MTPWSAQYALNVNLPPLSLFSERQWDLVLDWTRVTNILKRSVTGLSTIVAFLYGTFIWFKISGWSSRLERCQLLLHRSAWFEWSAKCSALSYGCWRSGRSIVLGFNGEGIKHRSSRWRWDLQLHSNCMRLSSPSSCDSRKLKVISLSRAAMA